ncbi:hypothetical protein G3576_28185 [Roseomonas stagni]|uniref:SGNH/GDSL hydrolase family protein n=1 Tax=Falsiroseomonas algicola TaxID=2716930 RepID=A0A6M1LTX4_9PROT|nr:hypothetical protein [Falsiroseomonas algicola]NGM23918.1 hypothetical protein [Falsiroseomonas algicola]
MRRMIPTLLLAGFLAGALAWTPGTARAGACPGPVPEADLGAGLPRLAAALGAGQAVDILLVGMGGARAGGQESPFAQSLAQALQDRLPGREVRIQIIPTTGMLAKDSAERVRRAATETEPALVVWRTGMADALSMTDPAKFGLTIRRVAEWLAAQQSDLVLVDLAYHAGSAQEPTYRRYVEALGGAVRGMPVPVFRRYAIMEAWSRQGTAPGAALGEACLGEMLGAAVARQAGR